MSDYNPSVETASSVDSQLIVGGEINSHSLTIASGNTINRGDVLSKDPATGKLSLIADGSEANSHAVAAYTVDASAGDVNAEVYVEGRFDEDAVNLNGADLTLVKSAMSSSIQLVKRYKA